MTEDIIRDEASGFLGRELTDEEWREAYPYAKRKLDGIISREGDSDGERREPYYLGMLVKETVEIMEYSRYCMTATI